MNVKGNKGSHFIRGRVSTGSWEQNQMFEIFPLSLWLGFRCCDAPTSVQVFNRVQIVSLFVNHLRDSKGKTSL